MITTFLILAALQLTPLPFPTVNAPTPIPTATPVIVATYELPTNDMIIYLSTAEANLINAPTNISMVGTSGSIGGAASTVTIFGYAKWLISPTTAQELFGPFGQVFTYVTTVLTLAIVLGLVYILVFIVVLLVRFVYWIISTILKFIPFIG